MTSSTTADSIAATTRSSDDNPHTVNDASSLQFKVTTSLEDAAKEILRHSFAIFQAQDPFVQSAIRDAFDAAVNLLDNNNENVASLSTTKHQKIVNGHLHGLNTPSKAKRLFRAFSSQEQPWPSQQFESSSARIAEAMHQILMQCYHHIIALQDRHNHNSAVENNDHSGEPLRKRPKLASANNDKLPPTWKSTSLCPLDYFFYHNQQLKTCTSSIIPNCTEHVDRGLLIGVCLSNTVPGLEVHSKDTNKYICPEQVLYNASLYTEREHPMKDGWICIMAGDQLSRRIEKPISCMHRVRNGLKRARMSISYELRI